MERSWVDGGGASRRRVRRLPVWVATATAAGGLLTMIGLSSASADVTR